LFSFHHFPDEGDEPQTAFGEEELRTQGGTCVDSWTCDIRAKGSARNNYRLPEKDFGLRYRLKSSVNVLPSTRYS
jgi:hypothetical protein